MIYTYIFIFSKQSYPFRFALSPLPKTLHLLPKEKAHRWIIFQQHIGKKQEDGRNKSIRYPMIIIQLNPSRIRMVSCLIFSANSWTPGKSSLCHALCDPFGTAACPVCHLALKIGAFNRRFWMFACFFVVLWARCMNIFWWYLSILF